MLFIKWFRVTTFPNGILRQVVGVKLLQNQYTLRVFYPLKSKISKHRLLTGALAYFHAK